MIFFNTSFTKWYVKEYHNKYDIEKMFKVYNSDNNENILSNMRLLKIFNT